MTLKTLAISLAMTASAVPAIAASSTDMASLTSVAQLGPNARARYQEIFSAIRNSQWADAQAKIDAMPDGPLHNIARAKLYLAKSSPKVEAETLATLAAKAPELPEAAKLLALAQSRGVAPSVALPVQQTITWLGTAPRRGKVAGSEAKGLPLTARITPLLKNDQPNEAEAILDANLVSLSPDALTEWRHRIAWTYFLTGDDAAARRLALIAATGYGDFAAQAEWVSGLAAWRLRDYAGASASFDSAARRLDDSEMQAAAHFWAARADMAAGKFDRVDAKMRLAARNPETFYGLLAMNRLGLKAKASEYPSRAAVEKLPNVRAALALAEIGERDLADELIRHQARIGAASDHATLANIAGRLDLPATQLWLAQNGPVGAKASVSARYPNPKGWRPASGWRVDRNLVFAHALQESRFRTNVTSPAGARGLMQVMPGTAAHMARLKGEASVGPLSDPSVNLEYGQTFMEKVRDMSETGGMLPKVIAAYNAGPLPVGQWNARTRDPADPLLYIESIPYWETRAYVATVMRNYWMYQLESGEKANSLNALAQGMWPRFPGLPGATAVRIDRNGGLRAAD